MSGLMWTIQRSPACIMGDLQRSLSVVGLGPHSCGPFLQGSDCTGPIHLMTASAAFSLRALIKCSWNNRWRNLCLTYRRQGMENNIYQIPRKHSLADYNYYSESWIKIIKHLPIRGSLVSWSLLISQVRVVCLLLYVTKYMYMVKSRALKAQSLGSEPSSRLCVSSTESYSTSVPPWFSCYMGMIIRQLRLYYVYN